MALDDATRAKIDNYIKGNKVFLFMKGTPEMPMCGFSAQVVHILNQLGTNFGSCNVLEDEAIRQGIKDYADWPTIPQLYVDGEFVGGCDIITEMAGRGDLQKLVTSN